MILAHFPPEFTAQYGSVFPRDYVCVDVEASGFSRHDDFLTEIGHCVVRNGLPADRFSCVLDWTKGAYYPSGYVESRLQSLTLSMAKSGRVNHMTYERLKREGIHPERACQFYQDFFAAVKAEGLCFVAHNHDYDESMLAAAFQTVLNLPERFEFGEHSIIDSGVIAKVCQIPHKEGVLPIPGESLKDYWLRAGRRICPQTPWSMDRFCIPHYKLDRFFPPEGLAVHSAYVDAWLVHLLMEEFRSELIEYNKSAMLEMPKIVSAERGELPVPLPARKQRHYKR